MSPQTFEHREVATRRTLPAGASLRKTAQSVEGQRARRPIRLIGESRRTTLNGPFVGRVLPFVNGCQRWRRIVRTTTWGTSPVPEMVALCLQHAERHGERAGMLLSTSMNWNGQTGKPSHHISQRSEPARLLSRRALYILQYIYSCCQYTAGGSFTRHTAAGPARCTI